MKMRKGRREKITVEARNKQVNVKKTVGQKVRDLVDQPYIYLTNAE